MTRPSDDALLSALSESQMYRVYAEAFTRGTGLPLSLHAPEILKLVHHDRKQENSFCALMAKTNQTCAGCYALHCKLEEEAQLEPKTLKCFAGLCGTALPVRVGDKLIAFLQTGQILLHRPDRAQFNKIAQQLIEWGAQVDLERVEEAFFTTRVLGKQQYESLLRLLTIFAEHLASYANALMIVFGIFVGVLAVQMLLSGEPKPSAGANAQSSRVRSFMLLAAGLSTGLLAGLLGAGGVLIVPSWCCSAASRFIAPLPLRCRSSKRSASRPSPPICSAARPFHSASPSGSSREVEWDCSPVGRLGKGSPGRACKVSSPSRCWPWPRSFSRGRSCNLANPEVFGRFWTAKNAQLSPRDAKTGIAAAARLMGSSGNSADSIRTKIP